MPRTGGRAALTIAAALCVPLLPFIVIGELPGVRWLSANYEHSIRFALAGAGRVSWPQFLLACGSGNLIYAGALALNGSQLGPGAPIGSGLFVAMLLPVAGWLIWRKMRRTSHQGD